MSLALAIGFASGAGADPLPAGSYRLELAIAARTALPVGETRSVTRSVSRVEIARAGSRRVQSHRVCAIWLEALPAWGRLVFPPRFVDSLAAHHAEVELEPRGSGWRYRADLGTERIGHSGEALPRDASAPSVVDSDRDGRPGATVWLSIAGLGRAELWLVQRARAELVGSVVAPGRVEGRVEVRVFEQRVIGARPRVFHWTPATRADPEASRFTLMRAPAERACEPGPAGGSEAAS